MIRGHQMMETIRFLDKDGVFCVERPENYSYLYFPIAGEKGLKRLRDAEFRRGQQDQSGSFSAGAGEFGEFAQ